MLFRSSVGVSFPLKKEGYKICHIEAGMRSYDKRMLEEINRTVCDHCSNVIFVYHEDYKNNLLKLPHLSQDSINNINDLNDYFKYHFYSDDYVNQDDYKKCIKEINKGNKIFFLDCDTQNGVIATYLAQNGDRKSTRLNSSHMSESRMPSSA